MINEKEMEEAIIRNPAKYIGEEGLRLVGRQLSIGGYRFDLLFEDRHGGKLIVELQRGILDRAHMFKILDYCDEFRDRNPAEFVEPMVIANIIPPERKRRLSNSGIPFREIPEIEFTGGMISKAENPDANAPGPRAPSPNELTHGGITPMTGSPTDAPAILSWEAAGLSSGQIGDLERAIQSFKALVLPLKKEREVEAEKILRQHKGKYTIEILNKVFDRVDKGPIGPIQGAWFGETLLKPNRNWLAECPIEELRDVIDKLRETGDLGCLGEWRRANKRNRGMKTGAATLLMYLHSPECYNVWLPKTHSGLSWLCRLDAKIPKGEMSPEKYRTFYKEFNEKAIAVRETNGLDPQAMDFFLFAVDKIKTKGVDRGLRTLIEAERSNADHRDLIKRREKCSRCAKSRAGLMLDVGQTGQLEDIMPKGDPDYWKKTHEPLNLALQSVVRGSWAKKNWGLVWPMRAQILARKKAQLKINNVKTRHLLEILPAPRNIGRSTGRLACFRCKNPGRFDCEDKTGGVPSFRIAMSYKKCLTFFAERK